MPARRHPSLLRIAATMAVCLAVSAVATLLGLWQYGRHVERADARAAYGSAVESPVADLGAVVPAEASTLPPGAQWRTVTATGSFDPAPPTVLRGRPVDGTAAWQYLAWFDTVDGQSLMVNLGWVPQPGGTEDASAFDLPSDPGVQITVVLRDWEEDDGKTTAGSITRITPAQLPAPTGDPVPGYGMLRELCADDSCVPTPIGEPVPLPELTLGPHLSYAWQWWLFAVMAPVGGVLLLRRDARMDRAAPAARPPQRRRRLTDEEIEDAL
ncbi:SURF1 family protein [Demequina activiva]|uniref:SURF1-like protein n=1 Tax=Demequina activiva TaxID=1582364 RepID=A0A919Q3V6_9MICO|nr:SURF1 family protein [Demequina activiva]GIG54426.1 hypothetical protein Dac01nite_11780 [Demequina activiva]